MQAYRIAHLGCGGRGTDHIKALRDSGSSLQFVGLCDKDAGRLEEAAKVVPAVPRFTDARVMLQESKPEIFSFVTQPHLRLPLVTLAIEAGVRAISIEKPMALSLAEAREICRVADEAGVLLTVCHQHKYAAHWQNVKRLIDAGELGKIREIHATSMGSTAHYATHLIDYSMWLAGYAQPQWALAAAQGWDKVDATHPSPGHLMGQFALENGVRILVECGEDSPDQPGYDHPQTASWDFWMNAGVTVTGTEGTANVVVGKGWSAVTAKSGQLGSNEFSFNGSADTVPYYQEIARCLAEGSPAHLCRGELALRGYEVLAALYRSVCDRTKIVLPLQDEVGLDHMKGLLKPAQTLQRA